MPKFEDFLNAYQFEAGSFDFEQFKRDLTAAHNGDRETWDARITRLTDESTAKDTKINKLLNDNFDMLQLIPADKNNGQGGNGHKEESGEDNVTETTMESLTGIKEKV